MTLSTQWQDLLRSQAGAFIASGDQGEMLNFKRPFSGIPVELCRTEKTKQAA